MAATPSDLKATDSAV